VPKNIAVVISCQ